MAAILNGGCSCWDTILKGDHPRTIPSNFGKIMEQELLTLLEHLRSPQYFLFILVRFVLFMSSNYMSLCFCSMFTSMLLRFLQKNNYHLFCTGGRGGVHVSFVLYGGGGGGGGVMFYLFCTGGGVHVLFMLFVFIYVFWLMSITISISDEVNVV